MDDEYVKKSVLITGCTTGSIGHALALEFQLQGFYVIATSRNLATMPDLVSHKLVETVQLDVTSAESIARAKAEVAELTEGRLDFLINNAGGGDDGIAPAIETDVEAAKRAFDLNYWGAVRMCAAFAPLLMRAGSGRGHIVNISSGAGTLPIPYLSQYGSAKAALNHYGDVLRIELAPFNVGVSTVITGSIANSKPREDMGFEVNIAPGSIYAPYRESSKAAALRNAGPAGRMPADEYARRLVRQVTGSRPQKWVYTGPNVFFAWILQVFAPRWIMMWLMAKMWGLSGSTDKTDKKAQ